MTPSSLPPAPLENERTRARPPVFRSSAVEHADRMRLSMAPLRIAPTWSLWVHRMLLAASLVGLLLLSCTSVSRYGGGPAVVFTSESLNLSSHLASVVADVDVAAGDSVEAGAVLVRFHAAQEEAELGEIDRQIETMTIRALSAPGDAAARAALGDLTAKRSLAEAHLAERTIRAPHAGFIGDIRVRPGQAVAAGEVVLTLADSQASCTVLAMVSAEAQPELARGARMRFEVQGYRYAYQTLTVDGISAQNVGPTEVRRMLGPAIADAITLEGPVNLVTSKLPSCEFDVDGERLRLYHGMTGRGEVELRREPLVVALLPALRTLTRGAR